MRAAVDTNVLVRAVVRDDRAQAEIAARLLRNSSLLAVTLPALCELVWVLRRVYGFKAAELADTVRSLTSANNVETNLPAVDAGLAMLDAGGDFADGVIAYEGRWLGAETFVSFDKKAVEMLIKEGRSARVL
jgi:predicted nucleic-acid-binding protein